MVATNAVVGLTDSRWFDYLRSRSVNGRLDEVNFWRPRAQTEFRSLAVGEPFFLRLKHPMNAIAGYDYFAHAGRWPISFFSELGDLALTAAKSLDQDALWKAVYDMRALTDVPQFVEQQILRESLAWEALHTGMLAEHNHEQMNTRIGLGIGDDVRDRLADLCVRAGLENLQSAVSGLFGRGHTMYIPQAAQEAFLARIENRSGCQLRRF